MDKRDYAFCICGILCMVVVVLWSVLGPYKPSVAYVVVDAPSQIAALERDKGYHKLTVADYSLAKSSYLVKVTVVQTVWPRKPIDIGDKVEELLGAGNYEFYPVEK